jgi:hypothetical protein
MRLLLLITPLKMEKTECSETSAYKIQMPGNYPEESIQHLDHSENFGDRLQSLFPQNAVYFVISSFFSVHEIFTFYIKGAPTFKYPAPGDKGLKRIPSATRNINQSFCNGPSDFVNGI